MNRLVSGRMALLEKQTDHCTLCGNRCGADRHFGEEPICGALPEAEVAWVGVHHGEEPPISGTRGCGNIFFHHCNLACVFCQNWQISNADAVTPERYDADQLAWEMIRLQEAGVHSVGLVSATSHLPTVVPALMLAKSRGLRIPVVYNSGGYDTVAALRLLDGLVDIYLPDMKYASDEMARVYSGVTDYVSLNRSAVREMYRQVGELALDANGLALRGLLIRHLVLPEGISDTVDVLEWISKNISKTVHISIMSQYKPSFHACTDLFPELNKVITKKDYDFYVTLAEEFGLVNLFTQELESTEMYNPDFASSRPFS